VGDRRGRFLDEIVIYFADPDPVGPSDMPIVVQHTCLDSRRSENAPLSTLPLPAG
jgi:hypothetical protein